MSNKPPSNVKIYERPERKGPSPLLMVIGLLVALLVGLFLYKAFAHHVSASALKQPGIIGVSSAFWPSGLNQ